MLFAFDTINGCDHFQETLTKDVRSELKMRTCSNFPAFPQFPLEIVPLSAIQFLTTKQWLPEKKSCDVIPGVLGGMASKSFLHLSFSLGSVITMCGFWTWWRISPSLLIYWPLMYRARWLLCLVY